MNGKWELSDLGLKILDTDRKKMSISETGHEISEKLQRPFSEMPLTDKEITLQSNLRSHPAAGRMPRVPSAAHRGVGEPCTL